MEASSELKIKLQRRRELHRQSGCQADDCPADIAFASDAQVFVKNLDGHSWAHQLPHTGETAALQQRVREVLEERDEWILRKRNAEASVLAQTTALGSQIARLRIEVEMLRRDLELAQNDANKFRQSRYLELKKEVKTKVEVSRQEALLAERTERQSQLSARVKLTEEERAEMEKHCRELEEQVARQIMDRMNLERSLKMSMEEELAAQRRLDDFENAQRRAKRSRATSAPVVGLDELEAVEEEMAGSLDHKCSEVPSLSTSREEFSEPLKTLEMILARIRGEPLDDGFSREVSPRPSEDDKLDVYDSELAKLEEAIGRLGGATRASLQDDDNGPRRFSSLASFEEPLAMLEGVVSGLEEFTPVLSPPLEEPTTEPIVPPVPSPESHSDPDSESESAVVDANATPAPLLPLLVAPGEVPRVTASQLMRQASGVSLFSRFVPLLGQPRPRN